MTKRFFVLLMLLVSVSLMTAGIVSAQNYWNNPWNNLPSNTGNPFVNTSPMYPGTVQAPASCQPNCYGWQNCTVPSYCYSANCASFVADLTIPDGSYVAPGTSFTKTWRLRNNGTTVWTTNYKVIFSGGTQMGAPSWFALPHAVAPGQTVDITVTLTAPSTSGSYRANFKLQAENGQTFGVGSNCAVAFYADIRTYAVAQPLYPDYSCGWYPYDPYCGWYYGPYWNWSDPYWNWGNGWQDFTPWW